MGKNRISDRARGFCFTKNNYESNDHRSIANTLFISEKAKYLVIGKEIGEINKTKHLQGYVYFKNARYFEAVRKLLPGCHIEVALGTAMQAREYCIKEGRYEEFGTLPKQGKRSDLEAVAAAIISGDYSEKDIALEFPIQYIKYQKGIHSLIQQTIKPRDFRPECVWLWGKAGVGKTYYAIDKHGRDNVFIKDEAKWWGSYENQTAILIDDFDHKEWSYRRLLRLLDGYPYEGETKGGHVQINSQFIYISCEYPPEHFWNENKLDQIETRFKEIIEITGECKRQKPVRRTISNQSHA